MSKYQDLAAGYAFKFTELGLHLAKTTAKTRHVICIPKSLLPQLRNVLARVLDNKQPTSEPKKKKKRKPSVKAVAVQVPAESQSTSEC